MTLYVPDVTDRQGWLSDDQLAAADGINRVSDTTERTASPVVLQIK
jgi:hypothetical protein